MIQVDIGGHPPILFGPAPSVLETFHFHHNLLLTGCRFLNFRSHLEALMSHVDIGGHPPIPFIPAPSVLLVFSVWSHFEALNDAFWENREQHGFYVIHSKVLVLKQIFLTRYGACQMKIL